MKLNKLFSWLLIFCMLCSVSHVFAVEAEIDTTSVILNPIYRILNIVDAADDKDLAQEVTRAEFAAVTARLVVGESVVSGEPDISGFTDVSTDYYEAPHIAYVVQRGVMTADNGKFYPTSPVTTDTVIKTMVTVLGYAPYAIDAGNKMSDYVTIANRTGLSDGIAMTENITRADLYTVLNNILEIDIMDIKSMGEYNTYTVLEDTNALKYYHNVQEAAGVVTADAFTGIYAVNDAAGEGRIAIDGKVFEADYADYLGLNIKYYYYDSGDSSIKSILYAEPYENKTLTISGEDIISSDNMTYSYYTENNNKRSASYAKATIIYNGALLESGSVNMEPESGSVTLIDNNSDNTYDIIKIDDAQEMVLKTAYNEDNVLEFIGQYGNTFSCDAESVIFYNTTSGEYVDSGSINTNQVLNIYASANGERSKIIITTEAVSATITYSQKRDGKTYLRTQDGVEYVASKTMRSLIASGIVSDFELGASYIFYLNDRGEIAGAERAKAAVFGDWEYAFLINAVANGIFSQDNVEIKICSIMNSIDTYPLANRVRVDGQSIDEADVYKLLCKKGESGAVKDSIQPQLIRIKISADMEVTDIDLAGNENAEGDLYMSYSGSYYWYANYKCEYHSSGIYGFKKPMVTSESPYIFCVPRDAQGNIDNSQEELFSCRSLTYLTNSTTYSVELYKVNSNDFATNVMVTDVQMENGKQKVLYGDKLCLYLGSQEVYEDGETVSQMRFVESGIEKAVTLDDDVDLTKLEIRADDTAAGAVSPHKTQTYSLKEGDLFIYATDSTGKINGVRVGYDSTNDKIIGINGANDKTDSNMRWRASAAMYMTPFYLLDEDTNFIIYTPYQGYESSLDGNGNISIDWNTMYSEQTSKFYSNAFVYNRDKNTVERVDNSIYENPLKFAVNGDGASKVITWKRYSIINTVYVYE